MNSVTEILQLADNKFKCAEILAEAGMYDDAYYMCGYAIELYLKASVCKLLDLDDFFNTEKMQSRRLLPGKSTVSNFRQLYKQYMIHDLEQLIIFSGLFKEVTALDNTNFQLKFDWLIILEWSEQSRYKLDQTEESTMKFIHSSKKILAWLRSDF